MAEQGCGSTVELDKSPVPSVLKRPSGTLMLCTPYRKEKRVPLRELVAHKACSEVPPVKLFSKPSETTSTSEGGYSNPTNAQMVIS